jgi:hypothetical protein
LAGAGVSAFRCGCAAAAADDAVDVGTTAEGQVEAFIEKLLRPPQIGSSVRTIALRAGSRAGRDGADLVA